MITIDKVYENALNLLNTQDSITKSIISNNIYKLNYIDDIFNRNDKEFNNRLLEEITNEVKNHKTKGDIMSLSAFVYKGSKRNLNVQPLIDALNSEGEWLIKNQKI